MEKKDIYEHLAKIYLDASIKRKNKTKERTKLFQNLFVTSVVFIFVLGALLVFNLSRNRGLDSQTALVLQPDAVKINFHFDPAKKEQYSISLNKLNLNNYKTLAFSTKKQNYQENIAMRIEFINTFKEKAEFYLKNIPLKWEEFKIDLAKFKTLSNWSEMLNLDFVVEEWNVKKKNGVVYLDNIRFLK
jgi:hypothetical protein